MLVLVHAWSRKTWRLGFSRRCPPRQRWRAAAMSIRACSLAAATFFERQAEVAQGLPQHADAHQNTMRVQQPAPQFGQRRR